MIRYGKRNLNINPLVYNEIMKLRRASEREVDQVYIREKKRLARLLLPGESYEDMICLLCKRIGL